MRKKRLAIKLLLPFISLLLSSCGANAGRYSYGDRDSFSYTPSHNSSVEDKSQYARGERIFDAFYDSQEYETNYKNRTTPLYLRDFNNLSFTLNNNGYYQVTLNIEGSDVLIDDIASLYLADINFDNHKDLCIGKYEGSEHKYYTAYAYDAYNGKKLLELNEMDLGTASSNDYAYNIRDNLLVVESSYNVNPISINNIGYFKTNTTKDVDLDWHKINFEIIDLETEVKDIPTFKGTDGVERYIVNTRDVYNSICLIVNFIGDFSTSIYKEEDVGFTSSLGYFLSITERFIDRLAISIKFDREGRYNIVCNVGNFYTTLYFEANNELYEMLQVAQLHPQHFYRANVVLRN